MRRTLLIGLGRIIAMGLLGYAAHSVNLIGMIVTMHAPPVH